MVKIFYSSAGGNTKLVVDYIHQYLEVLGEEVFVFHALQSDISDLHAESVNILACPTYEHGLLERNFLPFYQQLIDQDLSSFRFAIVGLGDDRYDADYHISAADILEELVQQQSGILMSESLRINRDPLSQLESCVLPWVRKLFPH